MNNSVWLDDDMVGWYSCAGEEYGNITVEHRIKANGDVKVRVIDINTVPVGRES